MDSNRSSATPFIVINEARSGSSWLQEISQMHPGVKVQFELDLEYGPSALQCKQCHRPGNPDSKHPERLPPKLHPPQACGFTIFGSSNTVPSVSEVASYSQAKIVLLLRRNHVAHAISAYRHFQPHLPRGRPRHNLTVPWTWPLLDQSAREKAAAYDKLLTYAGAGRPTHVVFYEDMKARVEEVWAALQAFLGLPPVSVPGIREAESRSSSRPALDYLDRLGEIQRLGAGSAWADMLRDRAYDERVDLAAEFARICRRFPGAPLSWRGGGCG